MIQLEVGRIYRRNALLRRLVESQYTRNDFELKPGVPGAGDTLEILPPTMTRAFRISFFGDEVERIITVDPDGRGVWRA